MKKYRCYLRYIMGLGLLLFSLGLYSCTYNG